MNQVLYVRWPLLILGFELFLIISCITSSGANEIELTSSNCSTTSFNSSTTSSNNSIMSSNSSVTVFSSSFTSTNCSINNSLRFGSLFADCTGRNLRHVPKLEGNITALDLSSNNIILQVYAFQMFPFLVFLKLSYNGLKSLPEDVFIGCSQLIILDLSDNKLKYNNISYPKHVFDPLENLLVLNLGFNDNKVSKEYLDKIFQPLVTLQNLTIDTFPKTNFGEGFGAIVNLRKLQLSGHVAKCDLERIHNDTLSIFNTTKLLTLNLSDCRNLVTIDINSFSPLNNLQNLHLDDTHVVLHQVLQALRSFVGRNMSSITLENIPKVDGPAIENVKDEILESEDLKYLNTICLSELNLANNHILYINSTSVLNSKLLICLKHMNIRDNAFHGLYSITNQLIMLTLKLNMEYLDISNFYNHCQLETSPSAKYLRNIFKNGGPKFFFPQKMKTLIVDNMSVSTKVYKHTRLSFLKNVLKTVSISHYDEVVLEGSISGLNKLTTLRIAYNNYMRLSESFFDTFPSLQNLYLNNVALPKDFFYEHGKRLFSRLANLVLLDLSGNRINRLPRNIFTDNPQLETLLLSNNLFIDIPIKINDFPKLSFLNLSYNKIRFIDEISVNELDDYVEKNSQFRLSLSGNNFVCFCNDVFFVSWLQQTNYIAYDRSQQICITQRGINELVMDINSEQLWQSCVGKIFFFIVLTLTAFGSFAFVSSVLVVKHKTQIMCFLKKLIYRSMAFPKREDFKFDIFLGYADDDYPQVYFVLGKYLEEHLGYSIYMYHKDSIPGESRACSILYGINNSWKTVFFVSQAFLDDDWSFYAMQAADYASSQLIPNRIILVKDQTNPCEIPNFILCVVDEDRILPTPKPNVAGSWDKLNNIIK